MGWRNFFICVCCLCFFFLDYGICDIMFGMKKMILPMMGAMLFLAGCQSASQELVVDDYEVVDEVAEEAVVANECVGANCAIVRYASPNGNDLVLETERHIIQIKAPADVKYSYRVWAGEKGMDTDPDLVVEDGQAKTLVEE